MTPGLITRKTTPRTRPAHARPHTFLLSIPFGCFVHFSQPTRANFLNNRVSPPGSGADTMFSGQPPSTPNPIANPQSPRRQTLPLSPNARPNLGTTWQLLGITLPLQIQLGIEPGAALAATVDRPFAVRLLRNGQEAWTSSPFAPTDPSGSWEYASIGVILGVNYFMVHDPLTVQTRFDVPIPFENSDSFELGIKGSVRQASVGEVFWCFGFNAVRSNNLPTTNFSFEAMATSSGAIEVSPA